MITEADTCRRYVLPKLYSAGWNDDQINEQKTFTDGRIVVTGDKYIRRKQKRSDFLLKMRRDFSIAVVEAKSAYKKPGDGLQQAKEYAEILKLKFAYSTNGKGIVEHDFITGKDTDLESFPTPDELWGRLSKSENITPQIAEILLAPCNTSTGKTPRYYQEIAINRAIKAILQGTKRILLTLATGTGKTFVSFQIIWKLWNTRWNRTGEHRRPRVLYLADRNILVDDPKDKTFASMGDARIKIEGEAIKSREIYFATGIPTNLLFFERGGPTKEIWYYEIPMPEGRKQYNKTQPMQFEEFAPVIEWWKERKENAQAWKVPAAKVIDNGYNLDIKNPNGKADLEHLPPEQLTESILKKEQRIAEIMLEIKQVLADGIKQ